jgi:glycosyltransferase involved in cell wall biosynthesis
LGYFSNKKFIFFISLFHHLKKMESIVTALAEEGANPIFLTAQNHNGCSPNLNFEATLIEAGLPYKEMTDYLDEAIVKRIAAEKQDILHRIGRKARDEFNFSSIIAHTVEKDLMFALVDGIETSHLVRSMLVKEKPDAVFVLHELNFWARILALTCAGSGIPLISFQEGLFYEKLGGKTLRGLGQYSTLICLWGEDARERIIRAGGRSEVIKVTGASHLDVVKSHTKNRIKELKKEFGINSASKVATLITPRLYSFPIPFDFFASFLEYVSRNPEYQFLVKFHPAESESQIEAFKNKAFGQAGRNAGPSNLLFFHKENVEDLLAVTDAALSYGSTASAETLALGKPLLEVNWNKISYNLNLSKMGVAQEIVDQEDLEKIAETLENGQDCEIESNVEKFIRDNFYKVDGKATERILSEVEDVLKNNRTPRLAEKNIYGKGRELPEISVIIPTFNRKERLESTILAYERQSLAANRFELIIVDDGSSDGTGAMIEDLKRAVSLKIIYHRQENRGPAAARNWAIANARSEIVLLTGDDIVPSRDMLEEHLKFHKRFSEKSKAILGHIDWLPQVQVTPLMLHVTKARGFQFGFHLIKNPENVSFWFFYTSNISLKRSFVLDNGLFDTSFTYAAHEDVELGYRLQKKGLRIVYNPQAKGYHDHPITLESFCKRQYRVGNMAVILAGLHPKLAHLLGVGQSVEALPHSSVEILMRGVKELEKIDPENLWEIAVDGASFSERISFMLNVLYEKLIRDSYARGILDQMQSRQCSKVPVSIILCVNNEVAGTRQCLEAIIDNTPDDLYEVVIVDNAAPAETRQFLSRLEGDVRVITNETKEEMNAVFNQGAEAAGGRYLLFMESKSMPRKRWLEDMFQAAEKGQNAMVVDGNEFLLVRHDVFSQAGMFDSASTHPIQDGRLWQRAKDLGHEVVFVQEALKKP